MTPKAAPRELTLIAPPSRTAWLLRGVGRVLGLVIVALIVAGMTAWAYSGPYGATKAAVIQLTRIAALEYAGDGIRVNCVCPGPTDTALFASFAGPKLREALTKAIPFRRLGQPADVANVVAFLASDEASFLTGQTVSVSGGLTMS